MLITFFIENEVEKESNVQKMHIPNSDRLVSFYNSDIIISIGYRVKSKHGAEFRRWANNVLKQYILQGYAVNERLLAAQGKTIKLQSRIIAGSFEGEVTEILKAVNSNIDVLMLLDNYDHQQLSKSDGIEVLNVSVLIFVKICGYPIRKRNVSGILPA